MLELTNINEVIDRLLDNDFNFKLEDNKLIFKSPHTREVNDSVLGFHYWGYTEEYYCILDGFEIADIVYDAFHRYKECLRKAFKQRIEEMVEVL